MGDPLDADRVLPEEVSVITLPLNIAPSLAAVERLETSIELLGRGTGFRGSSRWTLSLESSVMVAGRR